MGNLLTPELTITQLRQAGFVFWRSCNCGGSYKEKFKRPDGTMIVITPGKGIFYVKGQQIHGKLDEITDKLEFIQ